MWVALEDGVITTLYDGLSGVGGYTVITVGVLAEPCEGGPQACKGVVSEGSCGREGAWLREG